MSLRESSDSADAFTAGGVWEIDNGWEVVGANGAIIGKVHDVQPHYVVVSKGFFFPEEHYIPVSAITNVEHQRVYLNVSKQDIATLGWDAAQTDDDGAIANQEPARSGEQRQTRLVEPEPEIPEHSANRPPTSARDDGADDERSLEGLLRIEEIRVERHTPEGGYEPADVPAEAFQEVTYQIPIRGEEVDVAKRTTIREEIEISKHIRERNA
jgi:hypothetical protein